MRRTVLTIALSAALAACAPKVTVRPGFDPSARRTAALLPVQRTDEVARERADRVRAAVEAELKNNGYVLLDDAAVSKICADATCARRSELFERYGVSGVFRLAVASASRNNFLAGYYNTLSGTLAYEDRGGAALLQVEHTEREEGGLLFNTGQLVEGLRSTIANSGDESFDVLASRFARAVIDEIPKAPKRSQQEGASSGSAEVSVEDLRVTAFKEPAYQVCVRSQPRLMAFLVSGRDRANLREASPGNYCGIFRFDDVLAAGGSPSIEVRSPFGAAVGRVLQNPGVAGCFPGDVRKESLANGGVRLSVSCGDGKACPGDRCTGVRFAVYRAESLTGPYRKVGELKDSKWEDPGGGTAKEYQVVAIDRSGSFSAPVRPKEAA